TITTTPTNVSKTGMAGSWSSSFPPTFRNVLMNGLDHVLRRSLPKSPKVDDVQMPMLMIMAPPQINARMLRMVPHAQHPRVDLGRRHDHQHRHLDVVDLW